MRERSQTDIHLYGVSSIGLEMILKIFSGVLLLGRVEVVCLELDPEREFKSYVGGLANDFEVQLLCSPHLAHILMDRREHQLTQLLQVRADDCEVECRQVNNLLRTDHRAVLELLRLLKEWCVGLYCFILD